MGSNTLNGATTGVAVTPGRGGVGVGKGTFKTPGVGNRRGRVSSGRENTPARSVQTLPPLSSKAVTSLRQESTGEMETKCVTLLWLYILVLVPFDISSVDTSMADSNYLGGDDSPPLVFRILGFSKDYLTNAGPMRTMAGCRSQSF